MSLSDLLKFNSGAARAVLSIFYRPGRYYNIPFGPLRGMQLYYDRSVNYHAILGLWDVETAQLLERVLTQSSMLSKNSTVADVGANIGYISLWLSRYVVPKGRVYAFEPNPPIFDILKSNISANSVTNVELISLACSDHVGSTDFFVGSHHHCSSLHESWASDGHESAEKITVEMTTLDDFFAPDAGHGTPGFIKIDIEGGGTYALPGCRRILDETRPLLFVESHTPDEDRAISDVLLRHRYDAYRLNNKSWVKKPDATFPDRDGVWGTVILVPNERREALASIVDA